MGCSWEMLILILKGVFMRILLVVSSHDRLLRRLKLGPSRGDERRVIERYRLSRLIGPVLATLFWEKRIVYLFKPENWFEYRLNDIRLF